MRWSRWLLVCSAVSALAVFIEASPAAETQRIGLPAGYYKIPAHGRLRIVGYCMDQNVPAPAVGLVVIPLGPEQGKTVTPEGGGSVSLNKGISQKMLEFKTHEITLNEFLEQTEHSTDDDIVPDGTILFRMMFDPPGAKSETGQLRAKFGDLPLSEAMKEIHQYRVQRGADPKSITGGIAFSDAALKQLEPIQVKSSPDVEDPELLIQHGEGDPPQISLGATVTNNTSNAVLLELRTPLILSTDKTQGQENIDFSKIEKANGHVKHEKAQQEIWIANETLAAAHSRDYQEYLARFAKMPGYRGFIVRGMVHHKDEALVYVKTDKILEVRRVKGDNQETISRGPDAKKAFEKLPSESRAGPNDPPPPKTF